MKPGSSLHGLLYRAESDTVAPSAALAAPGAMDNSQPQSSPASAIYVVQRGDTLAKQFAAVLRQGEDFDFGPAEVDAKS